MVLLSCGTVLLPGIQDLKDDICLSNDVLKILGGGRCRGLINILRFSIDYELFQVCIGFRLEKIENVIELFFLPWTIYIHLKEINSEIG